MADRMRRVWSPFRISDTSLAAAGDARVNLTTFIDVATAREFRSYTVTRLIMNIMIQTDTDPLGNFNVGVRFEQQNVGVALVDSLNDLTADWLYWEEIRPVVKPMGPQDTAHRDIRSQRKTHGSEKDLWFYVTNAIAIAGDFNVSGRALLLVP